VASGVHAIAVEHEAGYVGQAMNEQRQAEPERRGAKGKAPKMSRDHVIEYLIEDARLVAIVAEDDEAILLESAHLSHVEQGENAWKPQ
jgi:hypothetical protein